jgi:hypothetical protein
VYTLIVIDFIGWVFFMLVNAGLVRVLSRFHSVTINWNFAAPLIAVPAFAAVLSVGLPLWSRAKGYPKAAFRVALGFMVLLVPGLIFEFNLFAPVSH